MAGPQRSVGGCWQALRVPQLSDFDRDKLAAAFSRQHGIVARRQVLACAMTEKALRYRTRPDGPWQVVLPGVYANERGRLSEKQKAVAAFLYAARGIAITEPFPSWLCFAELRYVGGLGELTGAPGVEGPGLRQARPRHC
jgi:hypothetical protein